MVVWVSWLELRNWNQIVNSEEAKRSSCFVYLVFVVWDFWGMLSLMLLDISQITLQFSTRKYRVDYKFSRVTSY